MHDPIRHSSPLPSEATDRELVVRLLEGDEAAFATLVDDLHGRLVSMARTFTSSPALAEDIVQETWLAVIRGLPRFEGRSSLRTWIFGILVKRARTMASREARRAKGPGLRPEGSARAVEWAPGGGRIGLWQETPVPWGFDDPAELMLSREMFGVVGAALEALPASQRQVVILRDVEDVPPVDICNILCLSETNLRVLLHRGRARIRQAIDRHLRAEAADTGRLRSNAAHAPDARDAGAAPPAQEETPS